MEDEKIQCYNKGCGQKFYPSDNTNESCIYHPGPPYFHDAYKIWKCCDKKSTDFSTWLSYKGCTKGKHNGEKPPDIVKQVAQMEIRPEKPEDVIVWNGLNKPAERPADNSVEREWVPLKVDVHESALKAISLRKEKAADENGPIGAACKNNSCKETFKGADVDHGTCVHHPGEAIFHEGMKYWTCCQKKTSNFSAFLDQIGCTVADHHCWAKSERVDKIREDWFSRVGFIHLNIYCRGALPDKCEFQSDGLILRIGLVHGFGDKESRMSYELWGEILPAESKAIVGERKVELILKQANSEGWPKLLY